MIGVTDLDLKLLDLLNDKSLFNVSYLNKEMTRILDKDHFWRKRFEKRWGNKLDKKNGVTWKEFYGKTCKYLQRYKEDPMSFFGRIRWKGCLITNYLDNHGKKTPLYQAPDCVKTNLFLLDLGKLVIEDRNNETYTDYSHLTPLELLYKIRLPSERHVCVGFIKVHNKDVYSPLYARYRH